MKTLEGRMMLKTIISVLVVMLLFSSGTTAWMLYMRFTETNTRREQNALVWHAVICDIERALLASKNQSRAEKMDALKFYDRLLINDIHTNPCYLGGTS